MFFEKHPLSFSFFIILILTAIAYGGSLRNGFVWDDETFIVNNPFVHDIALWPQYFNNPESISGDPILSKMYRPLQTLSFALDSILWGRWAGGFHLTSLLLHIASCIAIILCFRPLVGLKPSLAASFIFAVHPAVSEGVLSLASRGNQLYTLFALLSLYFFIRINRIFDIRHIVSIVTMIISLLSKEPAIAIAALMPLIQSIFARPWKIQERRSILLYIPLVIGAVIYLIVRSAVVDTKTGLPYWGGSLWGTIQMQAKVFVTYLSLLILPFNLKGRYSIMRPGPFPDLSVIVAVILNIALIVFGIIAYRKGTKGKMLFLAVLWFYISLLPVANLIPIPGSMMGERFLYFTFAGIIPLIIGAFAYREWKGLKPIVTVSVIVILIAWLITDIKRTAVWKDNRSFFTVLSKQEPDNPVVQARMAQEELASNNVLSAVNRLERVIKFSDTAPLLEDRARLHYLYGKALLYADRPAEAYREFTIAINLAPQGYKEISLLIAEAAARSGDPAKGRFILEQEIKAEPQNDAAWNALGNIFIMTGDIRGAISSYRRAMEINPNNTEAAINLRNALKMGGKASYPSQ